MLSIAMPQQALKHTNVGILAASHRPERVIWSLRGKNTVLSAYSGYGLDRKAVTLVTA